ncbi:MAG: enoyl-CoA hydratase/isomerase family protein [Dehalococcoidia bacterium]
MDKKDKYETILLKKEAGITTLTLNRPEKYNALNQLMTGELLDALSCVSRDKDNRVLVITGAGKAFCSGADVKDLSSGGTAVQARTWTQYGGKLMLLIADLEIPVIAKVNGFAVGIGCSLALNCDMVIASDNASFSLIFGQIGLIGDGGSLFTVPRLVGPMKAKELYFTGRLVSAQEAERIGLINKFVAAQDLDAEVNGLCAKLASGPAVAYGMSKKIINKGLNMDLASVLELEAMGQAIASTTEDAREAAQAFLEKRPPNFKGR